VVHHYTFDSAGRLSADTVDLSGEHSGQNVDDSVMAVVTTYDDVGRVETVTSYDSATARGTSDIVNQVKDVYDGWGNLAEEWQAHDGAVDTGSTPGVQYVYGDGGTGGVAKYLRLTHLIYPNGRDVQYGYGTAGAVDDIMSRLETISDGTGTLSSYKYLGAGQIVEEDYDAAGTKLTYLNSAGNNVTGIDRFGRIVDQLWENYDGDPLDSYTYTYDRAGNRTSKANNLDSTLNETYDYDAVDRLAEWAVGGTTQKTWSLDALGNNVSTLNGGTYNAANEETSIVGSSTTPTYDAAGNMTTLQSGDTAKYDAWNRMVEVDNTSGIVEKYEYDGTNRRIQIFSNFTGTTAGTVEDDYQSGQQVIESDMKVGGSAAGGYQYLWSPRYIDAPILRDTLNTAGTSIVEAERVFYLADANYNVTGLVKQDSGSGEWQVAERYTYDPYGVVTVRYGNDGAGTDWAERVGGTAYANTVLYTGRTLDSTGLYYYRARYYDAGLERFVGRDPLGYDGGMDLYEYCGGDPLTQTDAQGLWGCVARTTTTTVCTKISNIIDRDKKLDKATIDLITNSGPGTVPPRTTEPSYITTGTYLPPNQRKWCFRLPCVSNPPVTTQEVVTFYYHYENAGTKLVVTLWPASPGGMSDFGPFKATFTLKSTTTTCVTCFGG
jgi:RHS repeat-associated protein